jgi:acetolactate synthase-1/2/3 large subunit
VAGAQFARLPPNKDVIMPQYAIQRLYELTKNRDTYITTEVGQHQMWAAQFYGFEEPNRWMTSGGLGTMGYGLPRRPSACRSPIATCAGHRHCRRRLDPDDIQEMSCAVQYNCRSRSSSSTTSIWAWCGSGSNCCTATGCRIPTPNRMPDFVKLAEAYGGVGIRCDKPDELDDAIRR